MASRGSGPRTRGASSAPRGAHQNSSRGGGHASTGEKPKKENIVDLSRYINKAINISFTGGREVVGTLKGFDQLMNLVLDDVREKVRDDEGNESSRPLGLVVARGTLLTMIAPADGSQEIENPFLQADEES